MTEVLTSAQMRAIEAAAIASGAVTGRELMERAGAGVVAAVLAEWPDLAEGAHRAVVLCGPGNNGGDGFVVARLLKERGWAVIVLAMDQPRSAPPEARAAREEYEGSNDILNLSTGVWSQVLSDTLSWILEGPPPVIIDALFGIGLSRPILPEGDDPLSGLPELLVVLNDLELDYGVRARLVAVDVPTGLCADSGRILSHRSVKPGLAGIEVFEADLTVTFHAPKRGHVIGEDAWACGKLAVVDIGLGRSADVYGIRCLGPDTIPLWPLRKRAGHKFTHGHALILSGPPGHGGAGRLAARAALRIGAGLVTVACPPEALAENAARLDAVMLRPVADAGALADILGDDRITALCLGPGLGLGEREAGLVAAVLAARRPTVLDADALTLIARDPALFAALHCECVLTPHGGEFARLFPATSEQLAAPAATGPAYSKLDATRDAAAEAGCIVLFKGPDTLIAAPNGDVAIHAAVRDRAAPWLATAGSGDVLAGLIAGLMARGFWPKEAAETAAFLHVEAARAFGPGLIAEDLPEMLPKVMRDLGVT